MVVDWRGFELHPETPPGGIPVSALFGAARTAAMHDRMVRFAAQFGVTMNLPDHLPNTRRALAVAELARERDHLDAFRAAAMRAHWREGRNLEDDATLRALAETVGLDPAEALAASTSPVYLGRVDELRGEASGAGVQGIPTFLLGSQRVVGCQPYETIRLVALRAGAKPRVSA